MFGDSVGNQMGTSDLLRLKREMKHLEHAKQEIDRNRMLQEKRMFFLNRSKAQSLSKELLSSQQILKDLNSEELPAIRSMIQTLTALFECEPKASDEVVEALYDLDILSRILYHMGSSDKGLQTESLYLLSILLSNQSNLFSDSFLRKRGDLMLEQVIGGIASLESLKHVLYCFGNAPSNQLSKRFLDQGIPNILQGLLLQSPLPIDLLQTFSWFLNSCLSIDPIHYLNHQFKLISLGNADITGEVVSNVLIYLGQIQEDGQKAIRAEILQLIQAHNLLHFLEIDQLNYINQSQIITLLLMMIEINCQIYFAFLAFYRIHILNGLESSKDLVICETIKLIIAIAVECQDLISIVDYIPTLMKLLQFRTRQVKQLCLRFFNYIVISNGTIEQNQVAHALSFIEKHPNLRLDQILLSLLLQETDLQEKLVETIFFYAQVDHTIRIMFLSNNKIYNLLQNIGHNKNDQDMIVQTVILYKQQ